MSAPEPQIPTPTPSQNSFLQSKDNSSLANGTVTIVNRGSNKYLAHTFDFSAEEYDFNMPASESDEQYIWTLANLESTLTISSYETHEELGFYGMLFPQDRLDDQYC